MATLKNIMRKIIIKIIIISKNLTIIKKDSITVIKKDSITVMIIHTTKTNMINILNNLIVKIQKNNNMIINIHQRITKKKKKKKYKKVLY